MGVSITESPVAQPYLSSYLSFSWAVQEDCEVFYCLNKKPKPYWPGYFVDL